jgi:hypothetical protein
VCLASCVTGDNHVRRPGRVLIAPGDQAGDLELA